MSDQINPVQFGEMIRAVEKLPEEIAMKVELKIEPLHTKLENHINAFGAHILSDEAHAIADEKWKADKELRDARIEKYFWFASIIWGVFMFLMAPVYVIIVTHLLESWITGQPISLVSFLGLDKIL